MSSLVDLQLGDLGFGPISGLVGAGVRLGELAVAPFDHWRTWSQWRHVAHCGWITEAAQPGFAYGFDGSGGQFARGIGPKFAQAMPSGFEIVELGAEHWTKDWVFIRPNWVNPSQPATMADYGQWMAEKKIPYGFEDYAAIAGHRAGIHSKGLDGFIARTDADGFPQRAICSQALDAALTLSGGLDAQGHVFDDGRLPQDVTPSELYLRILELGTQKVFRPGVS